MSIQTNDTRLVYHFVGKVLESCFNHFSESQECSDYSFKIGVYIVGMQLFKMKFLMEQILTKTKIRLKRI